MKAMIHTRYGSPDVLELREIEKPVPTADEVLVRVRATSVNPAEWYAMNGLFLARLQAGLLRPKDIRLGADFAGVVEAVGANVADFKPGDEVFGGRGGAFAEYVTVRKNIVPKPANLSFEEAAAVPTAGITALQALRDHGRLQPGQRVLITGAAGGVGSYAVQIAKALGAAYVAGVCRTQNVDLVRSLGADAVFDYAQGEFPQGGEPYDLVLEIAGTRPWAHYRRILKPQGAMVIVGAPSKDMILGPVRRVLVLKLAVLGSSQRMAFCMAQFKREDFAALADLLAAGKVRSVIDRTYPFAQLPHAMRHLGTAHARGKIVVTIP
jgi:NADPH:quinone reductase-like Zn-dependent oxidoreductase